MKSVSEMHFPILPASLRLCARLLFIFISARVCPALAQTLSFPLEGFYHPGRAMPVRWDQATAGGAIELSADGAVTSRLVSIAQTHGVFPWLVIGSETGTISDRNLPPLRPLDDDDLLVINTLPDNSALADPSPNRRVIAIHVDPQELCGSPMAWQTADTILLSADALGRIPTSDLRQFFADGIELVVMGGPNPDTELPWTRRGVWWIASPELNLPPIISTDAYAPTYGWTAGRSQAFRERIFLFATIYCLAVGGIALWRSRWMPLSIVVASSLASVLFAIDNRHQSPIFEKGGAVRILAPTPLQDSWLYQVSHRPADFHVPIDGDVRAAVTDQSQSDSLNLILNCDPAGQPIAISGTLSTDQPFALMRRRLLLDPPNVPTAYPATSPLRLLATKSIYQDYSVAGQIDDTQPDESWPTVVLRGR